MSNTVFHYFLKKTFFIFALFSITSFSLSAQFTSYDEASDGDASNAATPPGTEIILLEGGNSIFGSVGDGTSTSDLFTFTVPAGASVTSMSVATYTPMNGNTDTPFEGFTGSTSQGSILVSASNTDILNPIWGGILTAGTYSIKVDESIVNGANYEILITGKDIFEGEINLKDGNSDIANGASGTTIFDAGNTTVTTGNKTIEVTVQNTSSDYPLLLSDIMLGGANSSDFSIVSPAVLPGLGSPLIIPANDAITLAISFTPSALGARAATLTIINDDVDESFYVVPLNGVGATAPIPTLSEWGVFLFSLTILCLGLVGFFNVQQSTSVVSSHGNIALTTQLYLPFDRQNFISAFKSVMWLVPVAFLFIYLIWGKIILDDLIGMLFAIPLITYLVFLLKK